MLQGLSEELHCLVDVTITYPQGVPSFWDFLTGACPEAHMHVKTRALPPEILDENTQRETLGPWVTAMWQEKDRRIDQAS